VKIKIMEIECETMPEFLFQGNEKILKIEEHQETNREKLRKMKDEELADIISEDEGACRFCVHRENTRCLENEKENEDVCREGIIKWLRGAEENDK